MVVPVAMYLCMLFSCYLTKLEEIHKLMTIMLFFVTLMQKNPPKLKRVESANTYVLLTPKKQKKKKQKSKRCKKARTKPFS